MENIFLSFSPVNGIKVIPDVDIGQYAATESAYMGVRSITPVDARLLPYEP